METLDDAATAARSIYDGLWRDAESALSRGEHDVDPALTEENDPRRGLSLVFRPDAALARRLEGFSERLRGIAPEQHFHAPAEMHVTAMSMIGCRADFALDRVEPERYVALLARCLERLPAFDVVFDGITASRSCVMAQGFPVDDTLGRLRAALRAGFAASPLYSDVEPRYASRTAHVTLVRLARPLARPDVFLGALREARGEPFGRLRVRSAHLVYNDWFHRTELTRELHRFALR